LVVAVNSAPLSEIGPTETTESDSYIGNDDNTMFSNLKNLKANTKILCPACYLLAPHAREVYISNDTEKIDKMVEQICEFGALLVDKSICLSITTLFHNQAVTILKESPLSSKELCGAILGCFAVKNPVFNWNITLPNAVQFPKPPVRKHKAPKPEAPRMRILHLTDIHIDLDYQVGALADCNQPLCCRNSSSDGEDMSKVSPERKAGLWGDYRNCDSPLRTVENMFQHLAAREDFDFVYWTGDLPAHDVWNQTRGDQLEHLSVLQELFLKYFSNRTIYPTLGNHEASPVNMYSPLSVKNGESMGWLYDQVAKDWTETGLPKNLTRNITHGAFYTLEIRKGLRLVSLNTNYCQLDNFWLLVNSTDPLGQLDWFANVLLYSEQHNEKVHIISHIHPKSCMHSWSVAYNKIVRRFESIITGQFFGHSHQDTFSLIYDTDDKNVEDKRPVGISYLAGSVTTYGHVNPNYRVYTVEAEHPESNFEVLDYEDHFMNVTEANLSNGPVWKLEYSAKDSYGLESLTAQSWNDMLKVALGDLRGPLARSILTHAVKSNEKFVVCDLAPEYNDRCIREHLMDYTRSVSFGPEF